MLKRERQAYRRDDRACGRSRRRRLRMSRLVHSPTAICRRCLRGVDPAGAARHRAGCRHAGKRNRARRSGIDRDIRHRRLRDFASRKPHCAAHRAPARGSSQARSRAWNRCGSRCDAIDRPCPAQIHFPPRIGRLSVCVMSASRNRRRCCRRWPVPLRRRSAVLDCVALPLVAMFCCSRKTCTSASDRICSLPGSSIRTNRPLGGADLCQESRSRPNC